MDNNYIEDFKAFKRSKVNIADKLRRLHLKRT